MQISLRFKMFLAAAGIVFLTTLTTLFFVQRETVRSIYSDENKHAQNLVNTVLLNVETQYLNLLFHRESVLSKRKSELKNIVKIVGQNIDTYYRRYKAGEFSEDEAKRLALEEIRLLRYDNGIGYIWINDTGLPIPKMIMHPLSPELDGTLLNDKKYECAGESKANLFTAFVNVCLENGSGYVDYLWPKPSKDGLTPETPKISYVELFPEWGWIIGTGVYIDDIDMEIQKRMDKALVELDETFSKVKVGKSGYMFLFTGDLRMLIHPTYPRGFDSRTLIDPLSGKPLMNSFVEAAKTPEKTFEYLWDKPDHRGEFRFWKRAYVAYFAPFDWYIASTVYNDELVARVNNIRKKLIGLSILFLAVAFFFSSLLSDSLTRPLRKLTAAALEIDKKGISAANIPVEGTIETQKLGTVLKNLFLSIDHSEKALLQSEKQLRSVIDSSIDAIISINREGDIILFNPAAERMFGYNREDIIGQQLEILIPEQYRGTHRENVRQVFDGEMPENVIGKTHEQTARRNDGSVFTIELSLSDYRLEDECFVLAVVRDITERKQLEGQLSQAQKMESVGRLAGGVAHDFNNLLTVILGNAEMALLDIEPETPLYNNIMQIRNTGERAANVTRQLLAFTRQQTIEPRNINLNDVIRDMEKMLCRLVSENIEFSTKYETNLWDSKIDPGQLTQVMTNLVVNAWDAMPKGGRLTIKTKNIPSDRIFRQEHPDAVDSDYVMISVSDSGSGIDENIKSKIFEPYFTTKEQGKGTGLGLAICYGIVKQNNGFISINTELGRGTSVQIYLPKTNGESINLQENNSLIELPDGNETVLVVEDDDNVRSLVSGWMNNKGYTIIEASNGKEALEKLANVDPREIHLLVCDIIMPFIGGKELYNRVVKLNPDIKVLYISGHTDNFKELHGIKQKELLLKPFSHSELIQSVQEVLKV